VGLAVYTHRARAPVRPAALLGWWVGNLLCAEGGSAKSGTAGMEEEAYNQLLSLVALFREHRLDELAVEDDSFKLRLSRLAPAVDGAPSAAPAAERAVEEPGRGAERGERGRARTVAVRSPLIGVFYEAPAPDAPPFVAIGDMVEEGQTVCVVEAMKVFNEIKAEWNGRVVAVPPENGKLVQAGDPLVVLEFVHEGQEEG